MIAQIVVERHQDAGGAEAALQGVMAAEGLLQYRQTARLGRQRLRRCGCRRRRPAPRASGRRVPAHRRSRWCRRRRRHARSRHECRSAPRSWRRKSVSSMRGSASRLDHAAVERETHGMTLVGAQRGIGGPPRWWRGPSGARVRGDSARWRAGRRAHRAPRRTRRARRRARCRRARESRGRTGRSATPPIARRTPSCAHNRGAGDDGEIAVPAAEFLEGVAVSLPLRRHDDGFDQFVRRARGRHHAGEEIWPRHAAPLAARRQFDRAIEREQDERNFRTRIGMRDRAADGAAAARLRVTDPRQGGGQQRLALGERGPGQQFRLPHARADTNGIAVSFDLPRVPADA